MKKGETMAALGFYRDKLFNLYHFLLLAGHMTEFVSAHEQLFTTAAALCYRFDLYYVYFYFFNLTNCHINH